MRTARKTSSGGSTAVASRRARVTWVGPPASRARPPRSARAAPSRSAERRRSRLEAGDLRGFQRADHQLEVGVQVRKLHEERVRVVDELGRLGPEDLGQGFLPPYGPGPG